MLSSEVLLPASLIEAPKLLNEGARLSSQGGATASKDLDDFKASMSGKQDGMQVSQLSSFASPSLPNSII